MLLSIISDVWEEALSAGDWLAAYQHRAMGTSDDTWEKQKQENFGVFVQALNSMPPHRGGTRLFDAPEVASDVVVFAAQKNRMNMGATPSKSVDKPRHAAAPPSLIGTTLPALIRFAALARLS